MNKQEEKTYTRIQYFIEYLTGGKFKDTRLYKIDSFDKIPEHPLVESAYAYKLVKQITEYSEFNNKVQNLSFEYEKNIWYLPSAFVYNRQELNFENPKFKHLINSTKQKFIKDRKLNFHEFDENVDVVPKLIK
jgi:hypothetical protein